MNLEMYNIRTELVNYMNEIVQFHYNKNDKAHDINHAEYVINRSLKFAKKITNIDYEIVYCVAAYHDVAHHIDAKNHEELSAQMLSKDDRLRDFFTAEQIKIMSEAVEDHRSSMDGEPRSIYGKIVSSADRNTEVTTTLKRCYSYNRKHYPELSESQVIEECRLFIIKKFGINGYARTKMYFDDELYKKYLDDIIDLVSNKEKFYSTICKVNKI